MGTIHRFPERNHARTSTTSRAAKRAKRSASTPAVRATSVASTADHHSAGMLLRLNHLMTDQLLAPTSAAIASRDGHSSMIERNEVKSDIPSILGLAVPKIKAVASHDYSRAVGQSVLMSQEDETVAESAWREAFRDRLRAAQGARTQETMAELLGISRDAYSKYVGGRKSMMPVRLLPRFAKICGVDLLELIEGPRPGQHQAEQKQLQKKRKRA